MKKIFALCLTLALLLCFVACGGKEGEGTETSADAVTDTTPSESNPSESEQTDAEETFSPDLNLTEIDRFN